MKSKHELESCVCGVVLLKCDFFFFNKLCIVIACYGFAESNKCLQKMWPMLCCYSELLFTLQHLLESHDAFRDVAFK